MTASDVSRLLALAGGGRTRPAIELAEALVAEGLEPRRLVLDLLTTTQERVGELWLADDWSVAQEHAATAVVDGIVGALSTQPAVAGEPIGSLVVACAEEEYHSLPARMGAELLRRDGWDVTFLGANVPAPDLQAYVAESGPDAVIVSCTIGAFLTGAARSLAAITALHVPALAAGTAFGATAARALALGANGWLDGRTRLTADDIAALAPTSTPFTLSPEGVRLELRLDELAARCRVELAQALCVVDPLPRWHREVTEELTLALRYLGVAAELGEPAVFHDHLRWTREFLAARGIPGELVDVFASVLGPTLASAGFDELAAIGAGAPGEPLRPPAA